MEWLSGFEHYPNGAILYGSFGTLVVIHRQMIMTLFRIFVGRLTQSGVLEFRFPKKIAYAWYLQVGGSCDSFPWCSGTPPHKNHDSGCWQLHWSDRHWPITYVQRTTWETDTVEVAWVKNLMKAPHFLDLPILLPSETPHTNHCHASQIGLCPNQRSFGRIWDARLFGKYQVTRLTSLEMLLVFTKPALKGQISFGDDVAVFFRWRIRCRSAWHRTLTRRDLRSYHFTHRCGATVAMTGGINFGTKSPLNAHNRRGQQDPPLYIFFRCSLPPAY